jgi:hypothetical protein
MNDTSDSKVKVTPFNRMNHPMTDSNRAQPDSGRVRFLHRAEMRLGGYPCDYLIGNGSTPDRILFLLEDGFDSLAANPHQSFFDFVQNELQKRFDYIWARWKVSLPPRDKPAMLFKAPKQSFSSSRGRSSTLSQKSWLRNILPRSILKRYTSTQMRPSPLNSRFMRLPRMEMEKIFALSCKSA